MPIYNPGPEFIKSSKYGTRPNPFGPGVEGHLGEDYSGAPAGTPIPAAATGTVVLSKMDPEFGNTIVLKHTINGVEVYTRYAHMNKLSPLKVGDEVAAGASVGGVGSTGRSEANHLHFEVLPVAQDNWLAGKKQPVPRTTFDPSEFEFPEFTPPPPGDGGGTSTVPKPSGAGGDTPGDADPTAPAPGPSPTPGPGDGAGGDSRNGPVGSPGSSTPGDGGSGGGTGDSSGDGKAGGPGKGGGGSGAKAAVPPKRDPLVLDLDGDGIETTSERDGNPVLFDFDGDGVKTGSGWVKPDDGFLALDLNSNAKIDTGRELFGVDTVLPGGALATDGFTALKQYDLNQDSVINSLDSVFQNLKIWRDLNQDGISQSNELTTLTANNIVAINLNNTPTNIDLGNGNIQSALGSFIRTDGTLGSTGMTSETVANLDLLMSTFYSSFTTKIPLTDASQDLPNLEGSGLVRMMAEAIELSPTFRTTIIDYMQQTTRQGQVTRLDNVLKQWSDTSTLKSLQEQAAALANQGVTLTYNLQADLTPGTAEYNYFLFKLGIVEKFMGFTYGGERGEPRFTALAQNAGPLTVTLANEQISEINLAFDRFKADVYESLVITSRFNHYIDEMLYDLTSPVDALNKLEQAFTNAIQANPRDGIIDLIEFNSAYGTNHLVNLGWDPIGFLIEKLESTPNLGSFKEELTRWTVHFSETNETDIQGTSRADLIVDNGSNTAIQGNTGKDIIFAEDGDDFVSGGLDSDILVGGAGNDTLFGDIGNDRLYGGAGNDSLQGDEGNDLYVFNVGFGQDTITDASGNEMVVFGPEYTISNVIFSSIPNSDNLLITFTNSDDQLVINDQLSNTPSIEIIKFADGTTYTPTQLLSMLQVRGTGHQDTLNGANHAENLLALAGDDLLNGQGGNDTLDGGDGNDYITGGDGNDTLIGNKGKDYLLGDAGNDFYTFAAGFGQDTVSDLAGTDTIQFGAGLLSSNAVFSGNNLNELIISFKGSDDRLTIADQLTVNTIDTVQFADGTIYTAAQIKTKLQNLGTNAKDYLFGSELTEKQEGQAGDDNMFGYAGNDTLIGGEGNDLMDGGDGNDTIDGSNGNDNIIGGLGNDSLNAGQGTDTLYGAEGNDTYFFNAGFGQDIISESTGTDTIQFGVGILASRALFSAEPNFSNNLLIHFTDSDNQIVVNDQLSETAVIETVKFADGTTYTAAQIAGMLSPIEPSGENDYLTDSGENNNYTFNTGFGQDSISDSAGTDTIHFGSGILASNAIFSLDFYNNLTISFNNSADKLTVYDQLNTGQIESIQFANGTTYTAAQINALLQTVGTNGQDLLYGSDLAEKLYGFAGDDVLYSNSGNDSLDGGEGNDSLTGADGNDTLDGGKGNDNLDGSDGNDLYTFSLDFRQDTLTDSAGTDTIQFGSGLLASDAVFTGDTSNGLTIGFKGSDDRLTINEQLSASTIETVQFADGTTYTAAQIKALLQNSGTNAQDTLNGSDFAEKQFGLAGDDQLSAFAGNDTLDGGEGNDFLDAGSDNDTLIGNKGNDTLLGGDGNDTFIFNTEFGQDTISDTSGTDTIQFGAGLLVSNASLKAESDNSLIISFKGSDDTLKISDQLTANTVENIQFADGTIFTAAQVKSMLQTLGGGHSDVLYGSDFAEKLFGLAGDDQLTGFAGNDTLDGGVGNDLMIAGEGNDSLIGGQGNDYLQGEAGNDIYVFNPGFGQDTITDNAGTDTIQFGTGLLASNVVFSGDTANAVTISFKDSADKLIIQNQLNLNTIEKVQFADGTIYTAAQIKTMLQAVGTSSNDTLYGSNLADKLFGYSGNDFLIGYAGNDTLDGGESGDYLSGGTGNDTYIIDSIADTVIEYLNEGTDTVQSSVTYTLENNLENLTLTGSSAINGTGNTLNNIVTGNSANNILTGGTGVDNLLGGLGDDTYIVDTTTDVITENANAGTDTVQSSVTYTLGNNLENLTLTGATAINGVGNTLNNSLLGNAANNNLSGGAGDDILNGGAGIDTLLGGLGNDTYVVDSATDIITENLNEGTDIVQSSVTHILANNVENLTLTGTTAINGTGNILNNSLIGNAANNILDGNTGADTLDGGLGNDTYIVDNVGDVITENTNAGTDTVQSSLSYILGTNLEALTLTGTTAINGTGNGVNNTIIGNTGNNILDGAAGADTMAGGLGNDTYVVDSTTDVITESLNEGTDLVQSSVTYTLSADIENLLLTTNAVINGTGNALNNTITGNISNNLLDGGTGIDTLIGGGGNDTYIVDNAGDVITENLNEGTDTVQSSITYSLATNVENLTLTGSAAINGTGNTLNNQLTGNGGNNILDGGIGNDTLAGGLGNDTYIIDSATDVITENANQGTDIAQVSVTYTLAANIENLTLTGVAAINGTGNTLNNILTGNRANNILYGGAGIDSLIGGLGNDTYNVDSTTDIITENLNEGTDAVQSSVTYTLGNNLENLILTGATAINGTGNTLSNSLIGNNANNNLNGGAGDDTLTGNAGIDTLIGGLGNDTYVVDSTTDIITENLNEGTDTIQSSVTYTLGNNLENLILTGTAVINGTGNTLNNALTGNTANNSLNGGTGNDTLTGGLGIDTLIGGVGNDTYVVDSTTDILTENLNEGTDSVQSSVTYTLGNNLENLTLTGVIAVNGTGNSLNNVITGNNANNIITGGLGVDSLLGGLGDDTYIVDTTTDIITENASAGTDTVQSSVTYTLGNNLENLTLTGATAINGVGNTLNNSLLGNAANNNLSGGAGDDILNGGAGIDTLLGGLGNDTYVVDSATDIITENLNEGTDTVQSTVAYTLSSNLENLTLTGTTAINGAGNTLNNLLTGNTAANNLNGGSGNDTLNGSTGNDTLIGGIGNDTYLFNKGDGLDLIQENDSTAGNLDRVSFNSAISKTQIAIFKNGNNLEIGYQGSTTDKITVQSQFTTAGQVERFDLGTGQFMTSADINLVVQNMTSYASANGIALTSLSSVQGNQNLMDIVAAGWHS